MPAIHIGNTNLNAAFSWEQYWESRYPSDLIVAVISNLQIDLSWVNNGEVDFTSIVVERSLDSNTWNIIDTIDIIETSYSDTDVTADSVIYFYRIRYVKGSSYSASTRITSMFWNEIVVDSTFTIGTTDWRGQTANNWSVADGLAVFSAATSLNKTLYRSNLPVIQGRTYRITFEVTAGETPTIKIGGISGATLFAGDLNDYAVYDVGVHTFDALCIVSADVVGITGDDSGGTFTLTSFSIKDKTYPAPYTVLETHSGLYLSGTTLYGFLGQYIEKSLDFGDTWTRIDHEFTGTIISCFVSKDGILFANVGTMGVGGTEIWRSIDAGLNWTKVMQTNYGVIVGRWNFAQASNGTMFLGEYTQSHASSYLWKSTNNGENWTRIDDFFADYDHFHQVFVDPETQRLYVGVGDTTKDMYYSDDEGDTWHEIFADTETTGFVSMTSVSGVRYGGCDGGENVIYKSTDDATLTIMFAPPEEYSTFWQEVASVDGTSILYAMCTNSSDTDFSCLLAKSIDGGDTWNIVMTVENSVSNFRGVAIDYRHRVPAEFGKLITYTQDNGLIRIDTELETWDCLNEPTDLELTLINGGVQIDWTDNSSGRLETEIWAQLDDGDYVFISAVAAGITTYDHICNTVRYPHYKLRTKVRFDVSDYSEIATTPISYFETTWQTENAGSASKTIVIPTNGVGYYCYVDWGDGSDLELVTGTSPSVTHLYEEAGIKTVKIAGAFPRIYFNNTGDKLKILTIESWGGTVWTSMGNAFKGCANLTGNYTDNPDVSSVIDFTSMFYGCTVFNSPLYFNNPDGGTTTTMFNNCLAFNSSITFEGTLKAVTSMFYGCDNFNQPVTGIILSGVTTFSSMFNGANKFNQSISHWDTPALTTMVNMFRLANLFNQPLDIDIHLVTNMVSLFYINIAMSTANYDTTLISWAAQDVRDNVTVDMVNVKYTAGGEAEAAHDHLTGVHGWTINDGGTV